MSKKILSFLVIGIMLLYPFDIALAQRGCCSHHGGVAGCGSNGRQICKDGTTSKTCTCTPKVSYVYGCTDKTAKNYNPSANKNDNSCTYYIEGCTDKKAKNYNAKAEKDNGSCEYYKYGCTDRKAKNYDSNAERDNNSCTYYIEGCTDTKAKNYNKYADKDNNSCQYPEEEQMPKDIEHNNDSSAGLVIYYALTILLLIITNKKQGIGTLIADKIVLNENKLERLLGYIGYTILIVPFIIDIGVLIIKSIVKIFKSKR